MPYAFGEFNTDLTRAIRAVARKVSGGVRFSDHAEVEMDKDDIDHLNVMDCLKSGNAYGPEIQNGRLRANVIHRNLKIRVVVGGLDTCHGNWAQLKSLTVVTVMRA